MSAFLDRVGAAPISWGICEAPGWGLQLDADRVLGEAQALGITAFEQGALGWLPIDPAALRSQLDEYGMQLLGGFVPLVLHDARLRGTQLAAAEQVARNMAAAGGRHFVTAPVPALDNWHRPALTDAEWDELLGNLDRIAEIVDGFGLVQTVHPHVDTDIETADDFQRFIDGCDSMICFDTGHLTIGGADVVEIARTRPDRIGLVHLKDVDPGVMARERSGELDLMQSTQAGLFPSLGDGVVPIADVVAELEAAGYDGWYVMETDVALTDGEPPLDAGPQLGVARSLDYLQTLQLPATSP